MLALDVPFEGQGISQSPFPSTAASSHFWLGSLYAVCEVGRDHHRISHVLLISQQKSVKEKN